MKSKIITDETIRKVKRDIDDGVKRNIIAKRHDVSIATVARIKSGQLKEGRELYSEQRTRIRNNKAILSKEEEKELKDRAVWNAILTAPRLGGFAIKH